jgi:hypothetical protein
VAALGAGDEELAELAEVGAITLRSVFGISLFKSQVIQEFLNDFAVFHNLPVRQIL